MTATSSRSTASASKLDPLGAGTELPWSCHARSSRPSAVVRQATVAALLLLLAGCNDAKDIALHNPATSTTTASPAPTGTPEQQAILDQYRKFWSSLTPVSQMPAAQRRAALTPFTMDPELKSLLAGMARIDQLGRVYYGADVPRAAEASIGPNGQTAVIDDCQDSRHSGVARRSDQAVLTRGVARNHVVVTMRQQAGAWKVYFVSYTKTSC